MIPSEYYSRKICGAIRIKTICMHYPKYSLSFRFVKGKMANGFFQRSQRIDVQAF